MGFQTHTAKCNQHHTSSDTKLYHPHLSLRLHIQLQRNNPPTSQHSRLKKPTRRNLRLHPKTEDQPQRTRNPRRRNPRRALHRFRRPNHSQNHYFCYRLSSARHNSIYIRRQHSRTISVKHGINVKLNIKNIILPSACTEN